MMDTNLPEGAVIVDTIEIVRYIDPDTGRPIVATRFSEDISVYDINAMLGFAMGTAHEYSLGRLPWQKDNNERD